MSTAGGLVDRLAGADAGLAARPGRVVVGIDGPDAAGRTTLGDRLAERVDADRLCVDDFLRSGDDRYRRGELEESLRRALRRDVGRLGSAAEVERYYPVRYLPGQALYRAQADPEARAGVLVDNEDVERPRLLRRALSGRPGRAASLSAGRGGRTGRRRRRPRPR